MPRTLAAQAPNNAFYLTPCLCAHREPVGGVILALKFTGPRVDYQAAPKLTATPTRVAST